MTNEKPVRWIGDVAKAAAEATNPSGLVRRLSRALRASIFLELSHGGGRFQSAPESSDRARRGGVLVPLRLEGSLLGELRICFEDGRTEVPAENAATLAALVACALSHMSRMQKLASVSRSVHLENRDLAEAVADGGTDALVARSERMLDVVRKVQVVARYDTAVLLHGESGTGKEVIARRIHRLSRRARQPFVAVNCGAIPESLAESELFGHEQGAFTGAHRRHAGKFRRASGGTIFLDEVAELSAPVQVKLLRALQEHEIDPVGAEESVAVDVRIIAATHRSLEQLIASGDFRDDLYYRLNVFPVRLPSLRERPEDVPALTHAILRRLAKRLGLPVPVVPARTLEAFNDYRWPGNVRELENVLERALIQTPRGHALTRVDLIDVTRREESSEYVESLDSVTGKAIGRALRACRGKIYGREGAAAKLGVKPSTLQSKMKRLGIERRDFTA